MPGEPPFLPMEAKAVEALPQGEGWHYEPKWDGFRCLAFVAGGEVALVSKSGKPLARYFPEVVAELAKLPDIALDGELIIPADGTLSFDALQMRLHPAASRIAKLAAATPAKFMLFDHLLEPAAPLRKRRAMLEAFHAGHRSPLVRLSPYTEDGAQAARWLRRAGGALDGVVAKRRDEPYRPGERAMLKVKRLRTADCIVGGFRYGANSDAVASLLLGLYDEAGELHHVGFTSGLAALDRTALTRELEALATEASFTQSVPGAPSRWQRGEEVRPWTPVRPERVVEVRYDHASAGRFRHGTAFLRWRPDKSPAACTTDQLQEEAAPEIVARALSGALPTAK